MLGALACVSLALAGVVAGDPPGVLAERSAIRKFYLTVDEFNGSQTLTACGSGYHFASIFEIYEPSSFAYDTSLGFRFSQYQLGPPSGQYVAGWIDEGGPADPFTNCGGWTMNAGGGGPIVGLCSLLASCKGIGGNAWNGSSSATCNNLARVWCVSDAR